MNVEEIESLMHEIDDESDIEKKVSGLATLADHFWNQKNIRSVMHYATILNDLGLELDHHWAIAKSWNLFGNLHYYRNNFDQALECHLKALEEFKSLKDSYQLAKSLNDLGNLYSAMNRPSDALNYYFKSLEISRIEGLTKLEAYTLSNIALTYGEMNEPQKSLRFYQESYAILEKMNDVLGLAANLHNQGELYYLQNDLKHAEENTNQAIAMFSEISNPGGLCRSYLNLGRIYGRQECWDKAFSNLNRSLEMARELKLSEIILKSHQYLAMAHRMRGDYQGAYKHYRAHMEVKQGIFNQKTNRKVSEIQVQYEARIAEKERELLRIRQEELENVMQQLKEAREQLTEKQAELIRIEKKNASMKFAVETKDLIHKPVKALSEGIGQLQESLREKGNGNHQPLLERMNIAVDRIHRILDRITRIDPEQPVRYSESTLMFDIHRVSPDKES